MSLRWLCERCSLAIVAPRAIFAENVDRAARAAHRAQAHQASRLSLPRWPPACESQPTTRTSVVANAVLNQGAAPHPRRRRCSTSGRYIRRMLLDGEDV